MKNKNTAATCRIKGDAFSLGGRSTFLHSGEVHYFRIPRRYWGKHFEALAGAGCNAVSTYVPWSWHEFKEGTIDFTGRTHPERDLKGFVEQAGQHGLHVTLGTIMLIVILMRAIRGHFKKDRHFGFEAVAWYWHFVDVVWLGLFVVVYWL